MFASNKPDGLADDVSIISTASSYTNTSVSSTGSTTLITASVADEMTNILELHTTEQKDQIIFDVLKNGRRALIQYQDILTPEIYSNEIDQAGDSLSAPETPLLRLIKEHVSKRWEIACANETIIWSFLTKVKEDNNEHYQTVLSRTAEYGSSLTTSSSILAVVLQLVFTGIDDECMLANTVFPSLWVSITNEGLSGCKKFDDYIPEDDLLEQIEGTQSPLFHALRMYYHEKVPQLLKQYKIADSIRNNLYNVTADQVTKLGWLAGIQAVKGKVPPIKYGPLLQAVKDMLGMTETVPLPAPILSPPPTILTTSPSLPLPLQNSSELGE